MRKIIIALILLTSIGVMGQTGATRGGGGTGATTYLPKGDTTGELFYWDNTNKRMVAAFGNKLKWNATNSRLGIGTNSPSYPLHFIHNTTGPYFQRSSTNAFTIQFANDEIVTSIETDGSYGLGFYTQKMVINTSGNVGIGTIAPATKLQVKDGALRMGVTTYAQLDSTLLTVGTVSATTQFTAPKIHLNGTDTTGIGATANIGKVMYYNGHFYGLIAGEPPLWKQLDN